MAGYGIQKLAPHHFGGNLRCVHKLCQYAELEKDIVVIGVDDHAEIWSDTNRAIEIEKENSPELLEQIAALGL